MAAGLFGRAAQLIASWRQLWRQLTLEGKPHRAWELAQSLAFGFELRSKQIV